jgi:hypothetical protein
LAFHQQAADELGGNLLGGAAEEGVGQVLGGRGGYGDGLGVAFGNTEISTKLVANNPRIIYVSVQKPFSGQPVNSLLDLLSVNASSQANLTY